MASHEEGEEARESDESMTTFEPYVAGKVRVSLSMVSYSRDGKQRGGQDFQQRGAAQHVARGQPNQKQSDSSESSGGIGAVFRKIRSTLSTAAGLQQPSPPANTASRTSLTASSASASGAATKRPATSSSSSGATKQSQQRQQHQRRPVTVGAARNKQPRQQKQINRPPPSATTSSKTAPQLHQRSSAPSVLRQPGKGGRTRVRVSPSRSSRATSPPVRGGRQSSSPPIKEGSPLVIDEMASFGPGSGRRNRPPAARLPPAQLTNRKQGLSVPSELQHQQRSKSEEPPSSPQWAEPEPPRALDDGFGRALSNTRQQQQISPSGDVHQISLMSYSDVHKHRAAAAKFPPTVASSGGVGREVGGVSSTVGGERSVVPRPRGGVKKPLNKQDLLKRIGSIENDEDATSDLKRYWMPDKACKECSECGAKFSLFLRRHHCRICGRIFCNSCCNLTIPGDLLRPDLQGNLRVCKECYTIFKENRTKFESSSIHQLTESFNNDTSVPVGQQPLDPPPSSSTSIVAESGILRSMSGPMSRTMSVRPANMLSPHKSWDEASLRSPGEAMIADMSPSSRTSVLELDHPTPHRRTLTASRRQNNFDSPLRVEQREDKIVALEKDEVDYIVSGVWPKFIDPECGLQPQNHRYRLRNFPKSYTAHAIVDWLLTNRHVESRDVAIRVGQTLVDTNRLKIISSIEPRFRDESHLYLELGGDAHLPLECPKKPTIQGAPKWFHSLPQDGDSEYESSYGHRISQGPQTVLFKKETTSEPSITITSIPQISESEPETSGTLKGSSVEEYLIIEQQEGRRRRRGEGEGEGEGGELYEGDEKSSGSPSSNAPILPDMLASRSTSSSEVFTSKSQSPAPSFDMIGTDELIRALPISHVTGLESASEAARDITSKDFRQKAESHFSQDHDYHFDALMIQLIKSFGLSLSWLNVVKPLVKEAARNVKTNIFSDDMMDINQYVKVKKIPGGHKSNSNLVYGVVCTKNVTHKKMETSIKNPTILLLKCAFEFQRRENTLSYFDTLHLQEEQYLKNVVAKVKAFRPSIILVQKSMSRLALEMLYELGIIVAVNVKQSVMNRVARCTEGAILGSLDQLFFDVRLGKCGHFYIRNYTLPDGIKKTLMYFDQCEPRYGCVITLQGASNRELKKVKKVTQFGLHIAHNSNLETAFLIDEYAWPKSGITEPKLLPSFDDFSPTPSTPEWPLYPSLAYPLDALSPAELTEKLKQLGGLSKEREERERKDEEDGDEEEDAKEGEDVAVFELNYEEEDMKQDLSSGDGTGISVAGEGPPAYSSNIDLSEVQGATDEAKDSSTSQLSLSECEPLEKVAVDLDDEESGLDRADHESGLLLKISAEAEAEEEKIAVASSEGNSPPSEEALEKLSVLEFQKAMEGQILSISPGVQLTIPYLQTVDGRRADARQYLPKVIYWSNKFGLTRDGKGKSSTTSLSLSAGHHSDDLEEMRLNRQVDKANNGVSAGTENGVIHVPPSFRHQPSYKSVSAHPLTTSIFLLQANTNEMKSALADYRARASLATEEDTFFFPSAKLASDYRLHLQNVFNAYKQYNFDIDLAPPAEATSSTKEGKERKMNKKGHRFHWKHRGGGGRHGDSGDMGMQNGNEMAALPPPIADVQVETEGSKLKLDIDEEDSERLRESSAEPAEQGAGAAEMAEPTAASSNKDEEKLPPPPPPGQSSHSSGRSVEGGKRDTLLLSNDSHKSAVSTKTGSGSGGIHRTRGEPSSSSSSGAGSRYSSGDKYTMTLDDLDKGHTPKAPPPTVARGELEEEEDPADLSYEQWATGDQRIDCLDPYNHQGISILFSNTCHDGSKHQSACVPPCIIPMFFYGRNDISLGEFLTRYCFRPFYRCPSCGVEMSRHKRHIVHGAAVININMQQIDTSLLSNDDGIYTWLACKHCAQCTPYTAMSESSLLYSFAKFLELKFHCDCYVTRYHSDDEVQCSHSLHKEYIQYFRCKDKLAAFQPGTIEVFEVLMPPQVLAITTPHYKYHHDYATEIRHVQRAVEKAFDGLLKRLAKYQVFEAYSVDVKESIANAKAEREALRDKVSRLKRLAVTAGFLEPLPGESVSDAEVNPEAGKVDENLYTIQDGIEELKRSITEVIECWNIYLEVFDAKVREHYSGSRKQQQQREDYMPATEITFTKSPRDSPIARVMIGGETPTHNDEEDSSNRGSIKDLVDSITPIHTPANGSPILRRRYDSGGSTLTPEKNTTTHSRNLSDSGVKQPEVKEHKRQLSDSMAAVQKSEKVAVSGGGGLEPSDVISGGALPSPNVSPGGGGVDETVGRSSGRSPGRAAATEYEATRRLIVVKSDFDQTSPQNVSNPDVASDGPGSQGESLTDGNAQGVPLRSKGGAANGGNGATSDSQSSRSHHKRPSGPLPESHKRAAKVGILSKPFQKLDCPFDPSEHHTMYRSASIPVAIYEKEPTSIIAFALTSREYAEELQTLMDRKMNAALVSNGTAVEAKVTPLASPKTKKRSGEGERPHHSSSAGNLRSAAAALNFKAAFQELKKKSSAINLFSTTPTAGVPPPSSHPPSSTAVATNENKCEGFVHSLEHSAFESASGKSHDGEFLSSEIPPSVSSGALSTLEEVDALGKGSEHISLEFTTPDKSVSFFCKVYYAEEFRKLRERIFPSGEDRYVRSLARCVNYDAKGGKSRSTFCKVADDRFIMKHIKSIEISSFEQFAPRYLEHVNKALEEKRPLTLAKIVGTYSIGFKNSKTGNSKRLDVVVMENLLYGHAPTNSKLFDLKGSVRSRYIDPSKDSSGDVLLDTNYLNFICQNPVYVYPHSKNILMQAIIADTEFLEENSIMDYSLLTCIDSSTGELVVGIIDYVRTFTLDKRLEMYVKKTAGRGLPTIVDPELYRKRFCEAMERYFTVVPDKWTGMGADVPEGVI